VAGANHNYPHLTAPCLPCHQIDTALPDKLAGFAYRYANCVAYQQSALQARRPLLTAARPGLTMFPTLRIELSRDMLN